MTDTPLVLPDPGVSSAGPRRRQINWRQEYLRLTVVLMTACWIAGWVALALNVFIKISFSAALGLTAANLLGSLILVRWLVYRHTSGGLIVASVMLLMWIAAGLTLLAIPALVKAYGGKDSVKLVDLFTIDQKGRVPAGPVVIFWVLFLWWRGYQFGSTYLTLVRTAFGMRLGILALMWVMIFASRSMREDILAVVPFFFFFGLLASSLARADSLSLDRKRHPTVLGRGWMATLIGMALILTLGGYLAALGLSGMNLSLAARVFQTLAEGAVTLLVVIISPILYVVQVIFDFLHSLIPKHPTQTTPPPEPGGKQANPIHTTLLAEVFTWLSRALLVGIIVLIVLAVLAFIWFLFVARARGKDYEDEARETLGTAEVMGGLRQAWRDSWRRLADALGIFRQFGLGRDLFTAMTIRRIYARMEKLAGTRGYPRAISETPYEYRQALYRAFPGFNSDVQRITEAYIAVRYGEIPENDTELTAVRAAWDHLHDSPEPQT